MKKIKRLITNTIIRLTPTYVCGKNTTGLYGPAVKYFTSCGISITNVFIPQYGGISITYGRVVFVIDDKYETISRLDVTTFGMSYEQLLRLYDKAISVGPSFFKFIQSFTKALLNADLIGIDSIPVEYITDTFNDIISDIIERGGISGDIFTTKNMSLILKKFGGTKGLTKMFEESIDASLDLCLLGKSPSETINNKCITCSRCRIVDDIRTCDDGFVQVLDNEDLSKYPDLHFNNGKLWSEYILKPQIRCRLYSSM